jgi:hypothetical protein
MGSSIVLATSRQVFAFSRDGAMPFSGTLYRMNSFTDTPVNSRYHLTFQYMIIMFPIVSAVWFSVFVSALLGLLAFAGEAAIGAVFSVSTRACLFLVNKTSPISTQISVIGLYIAVSLHPTCLEIPTEYCLQSTQSLLVHGSSSKVTITSPGLLILAYL